MRTLSENDLPIRSFEQAEEIAGRLGPKKVSVIKAENKEFLLALKEAHRREYAEPVLIGNERRTREIAEEIGFDISKFRVIDSMHPQETADLGVRLAAMGETNFVLRGHIDGKYLYRALIRVSSQRGSKRQICVVALIQFPGSTKFIGITDTGITVAPDVRAKVEIIGNAVELYSKFGHECPRVGIIAADRGLNDELDSALDSLRIREDFSKRNLPDCRLVQGSSLSDFLLGKGCFFAGFGELDYSLIPDILLVHKLEFGNIFVKIDSIAENDFFSGVRRHAVIMGAGIPVVLPSRSDTHGSIITEIALGVLIS